MSTSGMLLLFYMGLVMSRVVIPQRYILVLMCFLAIIQNYNTRLGLHIAITVIAIGISESSNDTAVSVQGGRYHWSEEQQGLILASFFPGYILTHLPGGMLADEFGGRWVLASGVIISAFLSFLTPLVIQQLGWIGLIILRLFLGLAQGPLFPASASLLSNWVPRQERSSLGGFVYSGVQLGSVCGNLFSGLMIHYFKSWPVVFYVWGGTGLLWTFFFLLLCYSKPSDHPFVTPEEKEYLETEIGLVKHFKVPWKQLLRDPALWALILIQIGHDWITYIYIVYLPKFLQSILHFDVGKNGMVSGMTFFIMWLSSLITGWISDYGINHNWLSTIHMRKLYAIISAVGPAICSILATHVGANEILVVGCIWIGMVFMGPWFPGPKVNNLDISVIFSGIIMSLTNGLGVISGIIAPYLIAVIAKDGTLEQWQIVFWISFVVVIVTLIVFLIFASGHRCKWDIEAEVNIAAVAT